MSSPPFIQRYRSNQSPTEIWKDGVEALNALGSQFVTVAEARGASYEYPMFKSTLPEEFLKLYVEEEIYKTDPWMELCSTNSNPILMDVSQSVHDFAIARLFCNFGFEDALLIPTGTPEKICGVVLYFTKGPDSWRSASYAKRGEIVETAHVLGTMFKPTRSGERIQYDLRVHLTEREVETLKWLAAGMQTAQIAHQMGVKPITVSKNFESIRTKLDAKTREQALYLAVINGLLQM